MKKARLLLHLASVASVGGSRDPKHSAVDSTRAGSAVHVEEAALMWPTVVLKGSLVDKQVLASLKSLVRCTKRFDGGVQKSNKRGGGWHSSEMLDVEQASGSQAHY